MQERPPASAAMQGGIDSELLRLISSTALQTKLDTIVGPKTLILTPSLAGPLGLVTEVGLLKVRPEQPSPSTRRWCVWGRETSKTDPYRAELFRTTMP